MKPPRLNPTLFDKLVADLDLEGLREEERAGPEASRATMRFYTVPRIERFNETALRGTVLRELNWLLNTVSLESVTDLTPYPEVKTSVLNYGVRDLGGFTQGARSLQQRAREIKQAIKAFEPRLDPARLDVRPSDSVGAGASVGFVISGDVTAAVQAMPVEFKTEIETDSSAVRVRE